MPLASRSDQPAMPSRGEVAQEFVLPDAAGRSWTLSELARDGSLLLVFFRGLW